MGRCYAVARGLNGIRRPYEPNPAKMVEDEIKTTDILHLSPTTAYIGFLFNVQVGLSSALRRRNVPAKHLEKTKLIGRCTVFSTHTDHTINHPVGDCI